MKFGLGITIDNQIYFGIIDVPRIVKDIKPVLYEAIPLNLVVESIGFNIRQQLFYAICSVVKGTIETSEIQEIFKYYKMEKIKC